MVFEKISEIIAEQFSIESEKITMETSFVEDLGADSLDIVELIMAIEEEYEIEVDENEVENISTVGDVVNYINEKK